MAFDGLGAELRVPPLALFVGVVVLGAVSVSVAASQFDPEPSGRESLAVPTSSRVVADSTAKFKWAGTVFAARHGHLVCYYLDDASGEVLVFPKGYAASQDLKLRDRGRRVVAESGFGVGIAFGNARVPVPANCGSDRVARAVIRIDGLRG